MKAAILSFTANGKKTAGKVRKALSAEDWLVAENVKCKEEADSYEGSLKEWTGEHWKVSDVLIYVGAAGIAVRAVASFVVSKKRRPGCTGYRRAWKILYSNLVRTHWRCQ